MERLRHIGSILCPSRFLSSSSKIPFRVFTPGNAQSGPKMSEFINAKADGYARTIELNRPALLHALNTEMVKTMSTLIKDWEASDNCNVIFLTATPSPKGKPVFCAGGDIVAMVKAKGQIEGQMEFFRTEYALNHLMGTCRKPIVSFIDGVTMGGGAGISVHGPFIVATENTVFAMPETAIGFFPDVGASFFLSRLGPLGTYLGLTGKRLVGSDALHANIATHYIPSNRLGDVKSSLASERHSPAALKTILDSFAGELGPYTLAPLLPAINNCFGQYEIFDIIAALREQAKSANPEIASWAAETLAELEKSSPTALFMTMEMIKRAKRLSFASCFRMEFLLAYQLAKTEASDFYEGVTAKLIEKTNQPKWNPPTLSAVRRVAIDQLFNPPNKAEVLAEFKFLNNVDYNEYPKVH